MEFLAEQSAEIIALCALFFTAWQAFIQRNHNKISVKPYLCIFTTRDTHNEMGRLQVLLINNGLGPAFINKFQIFIKGQECEAETAIEATLGRLAVNSSHTILDDGYAISHNETKVLLSVTFKTKNWEDIDATEEKLNKLDLLIRYSSAYGKQYALDTRQNG